MRSEVNVLRLISIAISSLLIFSGAQASQKHSGVTTRPEDVPFNLNHNTQDLEFGKTTETLFNDLSKNELSKKTLDSLLRHKGRNHSFSILDSAFSRLKTITETNSQDTFYTNCAITTKNYGSFSESLSERLSLSIDKFCRNLFLKRLSSLSPNINFSSRDISYFKEATPFFVTGENRSELISFLKHFKNNNIEHEKISNILTESFIEFKTRPPTSVLTNLKINPQFNKFLQNNLNLDDNNNSYFQDEFQRLTKEASESLEKSDFSQAKSISNNALNFYVRNKDFINNKKAWSELIRIGKSFFYKGKDAEAIELFQMAKTISSKDDLNESYFYLLWPHLINKDLKAMKSVVEKHNLEKNFDKFDTKLQYWIAYSFLKNGETKRGEEFYNKIIDSSPYSFYSIICLKELALSHKSPNPESEILARLVTKAEPAQFPIDKINNDLRDSLKRLAVWNKLGNERFANLEIRYIQTLPLDQTFESPEFIKSVSPQAHKEFLTLNLIKLLNFQKKYISSFKVFSASLEQNSLALNIKIMKYIFPLNYFDLIKKNSENLDPLIVISLIRQESAFNPEAKSGVGAKGLMQLMPATAKRFNRKVKVKHLGDPEINVAIGTKYLRLLLNRFDGNLIFALASYNAGEGRIDRWRRDIFRSDDPLAIIESIPFEETRNYVKFIYRNNFFYSLLTNRSVLMVPLEDTFKLSANGKN